MARYIQSLSNKINHILFSINKRIGYREAIEAELYYHPGSVVNHWVMIDEAVKWDGWPITEVC